MEYVDINPAEIAGYIVCGSHRARGKASRILGADRRSFHLAFTGHDISHQGIFAVTADEIDQCLAIKGVRKLASSRVPHLTRCW